MEPSHVDLGCRFSNKRFKSWTETVNPSRQIKFLNIELLRIYLRIIYLTLQSGWLIRPILMALNLTLKSIIQARIPNLRWQTCSLMRLILPALKITLKSEEPNIEFWTTQLRIIWLELRSSLSTHQVWKHWT